MTTPEPGQTWRHQKTGNLYHIIAVAEYTGGGSRQVPGAGQVAAGFPEGEKLVIYIGLYDNPRGNRMCCRPAREWTEVVDLPGATGFDIRVYTDPNRPRGPRFVLR